jgi:hypothetical protein
MRLKRQALIVQNLGIVRIEHKGQALAYERRFVLVERAQRVTAIIKRVNEIGGDGQSLIATPQRLFISDWRTEA